MEARHRGFCFIGIPITVAPSRAGHKGVRAVNSGGNGFHSGSAISTSNTISTDATVSACYLITAGEKEEEEEEEESRTG
jgi:hypothetical protein